MVGLHRLPYRPYQVVVQRQIQKSNLLAGSPDEAPPPEGKARPSHTKAEQAINPSTIRAADPKKLAAPNTFCHG